MEQFAYSAFIFSKKNHSPNTAKDIKNNIEEIGGFIEPELEEEFNENIECSVAALLDCIENIESDEIMMDMDEENNKDTEEEE